MAPIKAILRSKLDKADNAKSLQDLLVEKFEDLSDATSVVSSVDYQASSDGDMDQLVFESLRRQQQEQQKQQQQLMLQMSQFPPELLSLFVRPNLAATAGPSEAFTQQQYEYFSQLFYQQLQQKGQQESTEASIQEQPLNLTCHNALKRPAPKFEDESVTLESGEQDNSDEAFKPELSKRFCSDSTPAAPTATQRKRKRSYPLSDNEEICSYQLSAPELFIWNGHKPMIHQFLLKLLNNQSCSSLIRWLDRDNRLFKVLQPVSVARLWQFIKGNRTDNYECFARGIRHSRDIGKYFEAHEFRKKKVYKFSEKAMRPQLVQARDQRHADSSTSATTDSKVQHDSPICKSELSMACSGEASSVDVLAKLKIALTERMLQQKQQQQQQRQQQRQQPLRRVSIKDEPCYDDSPLVIADCEHL